VEPAEQKPSSSSYVLVRPDVKVSPPTKEVKTVAPMSLGARRGRRVAAGRSRRRGRRGVSALPKLPPPLECSPVYAAVFRFDVNSIVTQQGVSDTSLMLVPGAMGTGSNNVASLASAVRLRHITVWPSSGGEATVQWNGSHTGYIRDSSRDESLPTGITVTQPVRMSPPKWSLCANWFDAASVSGQAVLQVSATAGSVIDVLLDYTLATALGNKTGVAFTAASAGSLYFGYLDGQSSHTLKPLGRPSSF